MAKRQGATRGRSRRRLSAEEKALNNAHQPDREDVRRRGDHEAGRGEPPGGRGDLDRGPVARPGAGRQGAAPGADHRAVRPRVERQDDDRAARRGQRPADRRRGRVHRRRARARPVVVQEAGRRTSSRSWSASRAAPRRRCRSPRCWCMSNAVDIIVIDSVAALVPRAEIEGEIGDSYVGLQARLMSQALRKLTRRRLAVEVRPDLHQPDPREDRRDVRQPRDHARRPGPEVLQLVPDRRPADRAGEGGRGDRPARGSRSRSSRTRSPRRSASASST